MLTAKGIMKKEVITVLPNDSVKKTIGVLVNNKISGVAVKDTNGNLVGMVTEYDLILALSTVGHGLDVAHIMKKDFVSIKEDASIEGIADIFLTRRIKLLPVINKNSKMVGMLSRRDVLVKLHAHI